MNAQVAAPIVTVGTTLYSLRNYNADGFPQEVKVARTCGNTAHFRGGSATLPSEEWTTDWMTSLLNWKR